MKHLFHIHALDPDEVDLPEEEAHHARSVLRLRTGNEIGLLDGRGTRAEGTIILLDRHRVRVRIVDRAVVPPERVAAIHLCVAPTKQIDRFEWMLEKCTEIGVDRITPVLTERTERGRLRMDRLGKVIVSAMKQSQRAWLPRLDEPMSLASLIEGNLPAQRMFGWCEGTHEPLVRVYKPANDAVMLVGPEGDLAPAEADLLRRHGFSAVSLGTARLRTETAAVAACTWMNFAQMV